MSILFLAFVLVQYNDPDPLRWMVIYGATALISLIAAVSRINFVIPALVALIALGWSLFLAPDVIGKVSIPELFESVKMKTTAIELGREFGGLLIAAVWLLFLSFKLRKQ
jgi:hypothetical protein